MGTSKNEMSRRDFFGMAGALGAALVTLPDTKAFATELSERRDPICLIPETYVAGTTHVPGIEFLAEALHTGDELLLERDPASPYDSQAILVLNAKGKKLGFIRRVQNDMAARLMDGGKRVFAEVTGVELIDRWYKISIGVWLAD